MWRRSLVRKGKLEKTEFSTARLMRVLALETYWDTSPDDARSVRGLLDTVQQNRSGVVVHHRLFSSKRDLGWYLEDSWPGSPYDVLYLATHGGDGALEDAWGQGISRSWLTKRLAGSCENRVVYLSACGSLSGPLGGIDTMRDAMGAAVLAGYAEDVEWVAGAAVDLIALAALAEANHKGWSTPPAEVLAAVSAMYPDLANRTGFVAR